MPNLTITANGVGQSRDRRLERAQARREENWTHWLAAHWPGVRITDGAASLTRVAGRPRLHARVCVTLGFLLPADVRVELGPSSGSERLTLFSIASLRNGSYRYAVNAPVASSDDARQWTIRIFPARATPGVEITPVVLTLHVERAAVAERAADGGRCRKEGVS